MDLTSEQDTFLLSVNWKQIEGLDLISKLDAEACWIEEFNLLIKNYDLNGFFISQEPSTKTMLVTAAAIAIKRKMYYGHTVLTPFKPVLNTLSRLQIRTIRRISKMTMRSCMVRFDTQIKDLCPTHRAERIILNRDMQDHGRTLGTLFADFFHSEKLKCNPSRLHNFCRDIIAYIDSDEFGGDKELLKVIEVERTDGYSMDVYKSTSDDWGGSHELTKPECYSISELVWVTFDKLEPDDDDEPSTDLVYANGPWMVSCHGNDDFSMAKTYATEQGALTEFMQILGMNDVTIEAVRKMGFLFNN